MQTRAPYPAVYGGAPYIPQVRGWMPYVDPERELRREMRRDVSRLAFAAAAATPLGMILSSIILLLLEAVGVPVYTPLQSVNGMPPTLYYLVSALLSFLSILLPFSLFLFSPKHRVADSILVERTGFFSAVLLVLAGLFLCLVMNIPANFLTEIFEGAGLNGEANTASFTAASWSDVITMIFAVVLVAPVTEEFCYRGVIVAVMRRWGDWTAICFSALLFGMAHFSFQALPVVLTGGLVMAFLYVRTRNIWITITIHFLNNLIATLPVVLDFLGWSSDAVDLVDLVLFLTVIALGLFACIFLSVRYLVTGRNVFGVRMSRGIPLHQKPLQFLANPGMIVFILLFVLMSVLTLYGL